MLTPARALGLSATKTTATTRAQGLARQAALVLAAVAAITLLGQVRLPLPFTPVPVTLATLAVLGAGSALGSRRGALATLLLAALAALGAPVLAGWSAGVGVTFGYVLGYTLAAAIAGQGARADRMWLRVLLMLAASAAVYVPGVVWLSVSTGMTLAAALSVGALPFLLGDVLKSLAVAVVPWRHFA